MNTSIYKSQLKKSFLIKSLALFSLLAFVAVPGLASAVTYGTPITINNPAPATYYDQFGPSLFGNSLSMDGNMFVVSAPHQADSVTYNAGFAYLYDATTGDILHVFSDPTPHHDGNFASSISISNDKVLISDQKDSVAHLFDATTGALLRTFKKPQSSSVGNAFGGPVYLSGDKVLIGDTGHTVSGYNSAGAAYLFDATTGALLRTFENPIPWAYEYDHFGISLYVSGDKVLIGVPYKNFSGHDAGSAYLFDATTGALLQIFWNPTPSSYDYFGKSVFISGDKIWISAPGDDTAAINAGSVYIYDASTGVLLQTLSGPPISNFGESMSVSDDKVLISGKPGIAALYSATTSALLQTFNDPTSSENGGFAHSISMSGDKILISEPWTNTEAVGIGSVYLYLPLPDTDGDGIADSADNCPADANADQIDTDGDGQGNPCDFTPNGDTDGDGVDNLADNCPGVYNPGQEDNDGDGIGNVCDPTPDGDPDPNPTSIDQCKQLGWIDFAFRNQGQCVAFVNTGHDGR